MVNEPANQEAAGLYCPTCMASYRTGFEVCPIDGAKLTGDCDPLLGATIAGQYVVERCVGEGAMGRVYLAHHARLTKRRFALKVLLGDLAANPTMRLRFGQEAEAASRLDHPNVVSVLDYGTTERGLHYLVMDFIDGGSLCDRIEQGALSESETIALAKQICLGLTHAHEQGLVHRDFKPANVALVEHDGKTIPKILDFGLAIISTPEETSVRLTTAGLVVGTPAYLSPEQSRGLPVDQRTDLFAFGVSLYEMLAGQLPFDGTAIEVVYKNATVAMPTIADRAGIRVSSELEAIVSQLICKEQDQRFANARNVLAALDAIQSPSADVRQAIPGDGDDPRLRGEIESAQTMAATALPPAVNIEPTTEPTTEALTTAVVGHKTSSAALKITAIVALLGATIAAILFVLGGDNKEPPQSTLPALAIVSMDAGQVTHIDALTPIADAAPTKTAVEPLDSPPARRPKEKSRRNTKSGTSRPKKPPPVVPEPVTPQPLVPEPIVPEPATPEPIVPKPRPVTPTPQPVIPRVVLPPKPATPTTFDVVTSISAFDAHGSLSDGKVKRALHGQVAKLQKCYEKSARSAKRNVAVTVKVRLQISIEGRGSNIKVGKTALPGLSSCIAAALKKVRTRDKPDTGAQRVEFTLTYKPKQ